MRAVPWSSPEIDRGLPPLAVRLSKTPTSSRVLRYVLSAHPMSLTPDADLLAQPPELNLRDLVEILRRRRATLFQVFTLVLAVGIVGAALSKPVYQTHAKLLVAAG